MLGVDGGVGGVGGVAMPPAWDGHQQHQHQHHPPPAAAAYRGSLGLHTPGTSPVHHHQQDELLTLLDVIHRKTVRLRRDLDSRVRMKNYDELQRPLFTPSIRAYATLQYTLEELSAAVGSTTKSAAAAAVPAVQHPPPPSSLSGVQQQLGAISEGSELNPGSGAGAVAGVGAADARSDQAIAGAGGIVHSVQIRTGGGGSGSSGGSEVDEEQMQQQQHQQQQQQHQHHVNIEIKPKHHHHNQANHGSSNRGHHHHSRLSHPPQTKVSVVNLKSGDAGHHHPHQHPHLSQHQLGGGGRSRSFNNLAAAAAAAGGGGGSRPPKVRLPPGAARSQQQQRLAPNPSKSRSVENLVVGPGGAPVLGLKAANSEMNMLRRATSTRQLLQQQQQQGRLRGTTSELQVDRLSAPGEKVRLTESVVEGILSLPAELRPPPGGLLSGVRPDRERIGRILRTDSVVDLQRQLLTTVMENEVSCGLRLPRLDISFARSKFLANVVQCTVLLLQGVGDIQLGCMIG